MRIGSLFSGYGGLDMAVTKITGGQVAWHSDIEPASVRVLAHHWPDVPNLGDINTVDWSKVEPVDVLEGGFPCQDVSAAGKRTGLIRYGDRNRSGLWAEMARAINELRPRLVIAENVQGLLSAKADAHPDVFDCLACVADTSDKPMRALGAVLGDLAELGYDAAWRVVRASDVGAPHQRARVFIVAWPADSDIAGLAQRCLESARDERATAQRSDSDATRVRLLPTPRSQNAADLLPTPSRSDGTGGPGGSGRDGGLNLRTAVTLFPTPSARLGDGTSRGASHPDRRKELCPKRGGELDEVAVHLLPTPTAINANDGEGYETWEARRLATKDRVGNGNGFGTPLSIAIQPELWGKYADAVARWEAITRPAPEPTGIGPRGGQRLAPAFVEWMMGLPAGHITDPALGLTRNEQLKLGGNGVVPQHAEHAIRGLLTDVAQAVAA